MDPAGEVDTTTASQLLGNPAGLKIPILCVPYSWPDPIEEGIERASSTFRS
jgi:hypothetical protein